MAKTHFVFGDPRPRARTFANMRGKTGASIKPAKVALRTIATGMRLNSKSTEPRKAIRIDDIRSCGSDSHRPTSGTSARPQRSATQKHDVAIGAHAWLE